MIAKKKQSKKYSVKPKKNEDFFNFGKRSYYAGNCHTSISNKKKLKKLPKELKYA